MAIIITCILVAVTGEASPHTSLAELARQLDTAKRTDTTLFYQFSRGCIQQGRYRDLIATYRLLLDDGRKVLELADVPVLEELYEHLDRSHPNDDNFFICLYLGRAMIKYHVDKKKPLQCLNDAVTLASKLHNKCFYVKAVYALSSYWSNIMHDQLKNNSCLSTIDSFYRKEGEHTMLECNVDQYVGYSVMYYYLNDCPQSIAYLNKSLNIFRSSGKPQKVFDLYVRRALNAVEVNWFNLALMSLDSARLVIANVPRNKVYMNNLTADSLIIYVKMKDYTKASKLAKNVDPLLLDVGNDEFYDYVYNLGLLHLELKKFDEVARDIAMFDRDLKPWNIQRLKNLNELKYLFYKEKGEKGRALEYYEAYSRYNDSVHNMKQHYAVLGQQIKYNNLQKVKDLNTRISLLQKQTQIRSLYLSIVIVVLALTVVIVVSIYRNYKRGRKNIKILTSLNNQISRQKDELEQKNKEKDRLLNVVAHDLRSPVGNVVYLSDMMQMEGGTSLGPEKAIKMIRSASENALTLINELLIYSNDVKADMVWIPVDLDAMTQEAVSLAQIKADKKEQTILYMAQGNVNVSGSRDKLLRVAGNLLDNAIKFSSRGGLITVNLWEEEKSVLLSIADNGIGIPEHLQTELFDMLTPAKRPGTEGEKTFGLGLSICRQIVEAHGGELSVVSIEHHGTTFTVKLPAIS